MKWFLQKPICKAIYRGYNFIYNDRGPSCVSFVRFFVQLPKVLMSQSLELHYVFPPNKKTKNHGNPTNPFQSYGYQKEEFTFKGVESCWIKGYLGGDILCTQSEKICVSNQWIQIWPHFCEQQKLWNHYYYLEPIKEKGCLVQHQSI